MTTVDDDLVMISDLHLGDGQSEALGMSERDEDGSARQGRRHLRPRSLDQLDQIDP